MKKKTMIWLAAGAAILLVVIGALLYVKKKAERKKYVIEGAEGSYVYAVTGIWENGRVEFGFMNSSPGK